MRYRERLTITAASATAGTQDPVTHVFTPGGADVTLYDAGADVQDGGLQIRRASDDGALIQSDARAFLRDESAIAAIEAAQTSGRALAATVTWRDGTTSKARIDRVQRLEGSIDMTWLR